MKRSLFVSVIVLSLLLSLSVSLAPSADASCLSMVFLIKFGPLWHEDDDLSVPLACKYEGDNYT